MKLTSKELFKFILAEIQQSDTEHYNETEYDNWADYISDSLIWHKQIKEINKTLYSHPNDYWEQKWRETHKD